jgi:hypothetical protein
LASLAIAEGLKNLPPTEKPRIAVTDITWPAEVGQAEVCLWRDDKLAAVTITIDDNIAPDHDWWLAAGKRYGFPFTWFVITGRVDAGNAFFGTWAGFQKLLDAGHDVQSHTYDHFGEIKGAVLPTEENYTRAIKDIEANLKDHRVTTLAYPGGQSAKNDPALATKHYIAARGTTGHLNDAAKVNYMGTNSISGTPRIEASHWAGMTNLIVQNPARKSVYRGWASVHYHGLTNAADPTKNQHDKVTAFLDYLFENKDKFWVGTFADVAAYGQQRDTAKLTSKLSAPGTITLTLTDAMDDTLFSVPLTIKVRVDPKWTNITAKQADRDLKISRVEHDGGAFVLVAAVPDRGEISVTGQ